MLSSDLAVERTTLIKEIGDFAQNALEGIRPGISCVRQKPFHLPAVVVKEFWLGRTNLSGTTEPPIIDPTTLKVTEVRFFGSGAPKIVTVELELEAQPGHEDVLARFWHYGIRLGLEGDPKHILHAIGRTEPGSLNPLNGIIKPLSEEFEDNARVRAHNPDLKAFRDFLSFVTNAN